MSKRPTQLDHALADLESQIRQLEDELRGLTKARDCLMLQVTRSTRPRPIATPQPLKDAS